LAGFGLNLTKTACIYHVYMRIAIDGMHCQACVVRVRKALEKVPGVHVREVGIGSAELDAERTQEGAVFEAIQKAGYTPHVSA
jgi:copper chaperone CopZ